MTTPPIAEQAGVTGVPDPANWYPDQQLRQIADEIYERWDKDMRSGKLVIALSGAMPGYREDVTSVRLACAVAPGLLSVLGSLHILARRQGAFADADPAVMLGHIAEMSSPAEIARMFEEMPTQTPEQSA